MDIPKSSSSSSSVTPAPFNLDLSALAPVSPISSSATPTPRTLPILSPDPESSSTLSFEWLATGRTLRRGSAEPSETLAARRLKSAARGGRPTPVRRRSQSLELRRSEEGEAEIGSTSEDRKGGEAMLPAWLELAATATKDRRRELPTSPPLVPPQYRSPTERGDDTPGTNTPTTGSSSLSFQASAISSSSYTSFTTVASSLSPTSPAGSNCTVSPVFPSRRGSAPVSSKWTQLGLLDKRGGTSDENNAPVRSTSEQEFGSWTLPGRGAGGTTCTDSTPPPQSSPTASQYTWLPTSNSPQGLETILQQPSPTSESTPISPLASTTTRTQAGGLYASPRRLVGSAGIMERGTSHTPALPSPLSASHTPDELIDTSTSEEWISLDSTKNNNKPASSRREFPFPPSPHKATTPGIPDTTLHTPPRSPVLSSAAIPLPQPSYNPLWSQSQASSSIASQSPPEHYASRSTSRHLTSAADLAWNDLGLGRLGSLSLFSSAGGGAGIGSRMDVARSAGHVVDLMSLEGYGQTPMPNTGKKDTSGSGTTPLAGKRVGNEDLMGGTGGGHFGPSTRDKLGKVMKDLLEAIPISLQEEVIHIVEYGALNSRSASLVAPIVTQLASRHAAISKANNLDPNRLSFQITHTDKLSSDFRSLSQQLETHSDSYLNSHWQNSHSPSLENRVFSAFASRSFGAKVVPKATVSVGFTAMSLHWLSTDRRYRNSPATIALGELMAFLSARASEFKPGGLLAMAFICRSEDERNSTSHPSLASRASSGAGGRSNPTTPGDGLIPTLARPLMRERSNSSPAVPVGAGRSRDIWTVLTGILGKAIQRLVSTQLLKPAVARQLLTLPIHARTPRQTLAALRGMQHAWVVEANETTTLSHPAWRGLEHNTVSNASYADHTIQLLKIFWESEMRCILREALMSRAAVEWILESLFDTAREKVEEEGPQPLELEVQIVALRRKDDTQETEKPSV